MMGTTLKDLAIALNDYESKSLNTLLVNHNIPPKVFTNIVLNEVKKNQKLFQAYIDSPLTFFGSITFCAEMGLIPNSELGQFYFSTVQVLDGRVYVKPIIGYLGMIEILYRNPKIKSISSESVHEGDIFEYELGLTPILKHTPLDEIRNADTLTHVYMVVELDNGLKQFKVMSKYSLLQTIEIQKDKNALYFSKKDPNFWMLKKIVLKQMSKTLPKDYLSAMAIKFDDGLEGGKIISLDENQNVVLNEEKPQKQSLNFDFGEESLFEL